ncbi:hypothetical protein ADK96_27030 [Streptomyces sp. IGB124]|nr:hypothetical protein ADK96_27030 [Streptomyces sp. IGB124]
MPETSRLRLWTETNRNNRPRLVESATTIHFFKASDRGDIVIRVFYPGSATLKADDVVFAFSLCLNFEEIEAVCKECEPYALVASDESRKEVGPLTSDVRCEPFGDIFARDASTVISDGDRVFVSVESNTDLAVALEVGSGQHLIDSILDRLGDDICGVVVTLDDVDYPLLHPGLSVVVSESLKRMDIAWHPCS